MLADPTWTETHQPGSSVFVGLGGNATGILIKAAWGGGSSENELFEPNDGDEVPVPAASMMVIEAIIYLTHPHILVYIGVHGGRYEHRTKDTSRSNSLFLRSR